jgi:ribonucleoside-diphosphate reductase alpha chain
MNNISDNAMTILKARYLRKDENGNVIESPEDMFLRVASFLAGGDVELTAKFYDVMASLDFLPNTPTLINAGRPDGQLSACFVLPVEDNMESIFDAVKYSALIHKTGGGTGFSFSRLRPKGARVSTTGGESSGVISFMRVFNAATESVKQGGVRRGANMGLLRVDHPDIEEFITCKDDPNEFNNFNISVGITDYFMEAVRENDRYFELIDPHTNKVVKTVRARDIWDKIVHQAWKNGEPGIIFLDTVNKHNPNKTIGDFEATNPCGEQPLLPYESCNLGSINLSNFVDETRKTFDFPRFRATISTAVDFLNAVLDHNVFPLPQVKEATLRTRKIGLGVMGFADVLLKLGLRYDSENAISVAEFIMSDLFAMGRYRSYEMEYYNSTITTIAPTGTISMIANTSSGIEPNFSWVYKRIADGKELYVVHPFMEKKLKEVGLYTDDILEKLGRGISVVDIPELQIAGFGDYWQISKEIDPEAHIAVQAAFQKYTDNAVSKTINLPSGAIERDVGMAFQKAYLSECKGITVYRDGSRDGQVLSFEKDTETADAVELVGGVASAPTSTDEYLCEKCGTLLVRAEGCALCYVCGHSKCL